MKTILLGFEDERMNGKSVLLAGPEVPANQQIQRVFDEKGGRDTKLPEGIKVLAVFQLSNPHILSHSVAHTKAQRAEIKKREEAEAKAAKAKAEAEAKAKKPGEAK